MENNIPSPRRRHRRVRDRIFNRTLCALLATTGIFGGIFMLFAGIVCVFFHDVMDGDIVFDRAGTAMLILAIPCLLIGSIFLDEMNTHNS